MSNKQKNENKKRKSFFFSRSIIEEIQSMPEIEEEMEKKRVREEINGEIEQVNRQPEVFPKKNSLGLVGTNNDKKKLKINVNNDENLIEQSETRESKLPKNEVDILDYVEKVKKLESKNRSQISAFNELKEKVKEEHNLHKELQNRYDSISAKFFTSSEEVKNEKNLNEELKLRVAKITEEKSKVQESYNELKNEMISLKQRLKDGEIKQKAEIGNILVKLYEDYPTSEALEIARKNLKDKRLSAKMIVENAEKKAEQIVEKTTEKCEKMLQEAENEVNVLRSNNHETMKVFEQQIKEYGDKLLEIKETIDGVYLHRYYDKK